MNDPMKKAEAAGWKIFKKKIGKNVFRHYGHSKRGTCTVFTQTIPGDDNIESMMWKVNLHIPRHYQ